jgi:hypothetical protein
MIQGAVNGDGFMSTMDSWKTRVTRLTFDEFVKLEELDCYIVKCLLNGQETLTHS